MPEFKQIAEFMGLDPDKIKTIDDFKPAFESEFIRKSALKDDHSILAPFIGKRLGSIETELKRMGKEYAIDLSTEEFKGKPIEEQTKLLVHKMAENNLKTVTDLEAKVNQSADAASLEWKTKYEAEAKKRGEQETLLGETVGKYNDFVKTSDDKIKSFKMSNLKEKVWSEIKFKTGISDIEKKGFEAHINDKYKFELGENDKFEIRDKEGKPISSTKVTGAYRDPLDVLNEEAVNAKLFEINPHAGKQANQFQQLAQQQNQQPEKKKVSLHPFLKSQQG